LLKSDRAFFMGCSILQFWGSQITTNVPMQVLIIGCGIVGATIAYELSQIPGLDITVVDRQAQLPQANATTYDTGTGAALGLLMASISKKTKGRNLAMRFAGVDWYDRVIPEIEALTGLVVPVNRQGLLMLEFEPHKLDTWEKLIPIRQAQGRRLEIWDRAKLQTQAPHLDLTDVAAGIYAPDDRQIHPAIVTQVLVQAAQNRGVNFRFGVDVVGCVALRDNASPEPDRVRQILTNQGPIDCEQLVIAAGLGSFPLSQTLGQPIALRPVLGQAIQLRSPTQLGIPDFQPVYTGHDIHLVPLGRVENHWEYWVGATVEFGEDADPTADRQMFDTLMQSAIGLYPGLQSATPIRQWSGLRPRPEGRPAPVIERLPDYDNVIIAAGHYRNGVLLAPATAIAVRSLLTQDNTGKTWLS
jgi:glycine/D-amino acid oxidase-like deaminating enzyme